MPVFLLATILHIFGLSYLGPITTQPESVQLAAAQTLIGQTRVAGSASVGPLLTSPMVKPPVSLTADAGIVLDIDSGLALWKKNIDQPRPLASLTKLMTALVFLDTQPDWDREVAFEKSDIDTTEGNTLIVKPGEQAKVRDLFMASLVASANNATKALARSTGLSEPDFIQRMNDKAKSLNLWLTTFTDVTGLDAGNVSTVRDYIRLAQVAFDQPRIKEAVTTKEYAFTTTGVKASHRLFNTDQLLSDKTVSVKAAKTGFINESGYNFVVLADANGHDVLLVVLGSSSSEARFSEARSLIQWTQQYWQWW
ncbi:MAG: serine hydrolase [Patescibacteria group bacterium]|jgi:D-alanyl-D-alanine carboxypeptidase